MKTFILTSILLISVVFLHAQVTYTVTSPTLDGSTGALDYIIPLAKADANVGNDVTIYFNVPELNGNPQFVTLSEYFVIDITAGSITFDKSPSATSDQGIEFDQTQIEDDLFTKGFIISNGVSSEVTFKNLYFMNFQASHIVDDDNYKCSIYLSNSNNVTIINNFFKFNQVSIQIYNSNNNIIIKYNDFNINNPDLSNIKTYYGNYIYQGIYINVNNIYEVSNNLFYNNSLSNVAIFSLCSFSGNLSDFKFFQNNFNNLYRAFDINNRYHPQPPPNIEIYSNIITNVYNGLHLKYPSYPTNIANNQFVNTAQGIILRGEEFYNDVGIDFIELNNNINETAVNYGNTFTNTTEYTFGCFATKMPTDDLLRVRIIGYNLDACISKLSYAKLFVRDNSIVSNLVSDFPLYGGYFVVHSPDILNTEINNNILNISYNLTDLNGHNVYVDFYKSNSNGDLLEYIGNSHVTSVTGTESASIVIPSGMTLTSTDRIAATTSAYESDNTSSPYGTSEVSYKVICNPPPISITTSSPTCQSTPVHLTTGLPTGTGLYTYNWSFSDGGSSVLDEPDYTFTATGINTAYVTVSGCSTTVTAQKDINVVAPLTSVSITTPAEQCLNTSVTFTTDLPTGIYTYSWNFGDSSSEQNTSSDESPVHTFTEINNYQVNVTVTGCSSQVNATTNIITRPPLTFSISNTNSCVNNPTNFYWDFSDNVINATYLWDFGEVPTSTESTPSHTYSTAGTYSVSVTINSNNYCTTSQQTSVTISDCNCEHLSNITADVYATILPRAVCIYGCGCVNASVIGLLYSPESYTLAWDFGDGSGTFYGGQNVHHIYTEYGQNYNITLTVSLVGCDDFVIHTTYSTQCEPCLSEPPSISSEPLVADGNYCSSTEYTFSLNPKAQPPNYSGLLWDFGDGTTSTEFNPTHTYSVAGTYHITATTVSTFCPVLVSSLDISVAVCNNCFAGPLAITAQSSPYCQSEDITFTTNFPTTNTNYSTMQWNFGDGSTSATGNSVTHSFTTVKDYFVSVMIQSVNETTCPSLSANITLTVDECPCNSINNLKIKNSDKKCINQSIVFSTNIWLTVFYDFSWSFSGGSVTSSTSANVTTTFTQPGDYTISVTASRSDCIEKTATITITVGECCNECVPTFAPEKGGKYLLSAWVSEDAVNAETYSNPEIWIAFPNLGTEMGPFKAKGKIIDGWQQISEEFTIPPTASKIKIRLNNVGTGDVYFDDLRVHNFNGNMKTYVYDLKLMQVSAILDENNYATFYEYDDQGMLVRVKKETERGIVTIQESRNNTPVQAP